MRIAVTGANGFLGRSIVAAAARAGVDACPVHRAAWADGSLARWLADVDAVIDAATHGAGDAAREVARFAALLDATPPSARLVVSSSLAVLDFARLDPAAAVDERSATQARPRDAYSAAKLEIERAADAWRRRSGGSVVIARPGPILGDGRAWTARLGVRLPGGRWVAVGDGAAVPWVHVDACAAAFIRLAMAERPPGVVHLMQHVLPTQRDLAQRLARSRRLRPPTLRIPDDRWERLTRLVGALGPLGRVLPAAFDPDRAAARFGRFRFYGALARDWIDGGDEAAANRWLDGGVQATGHLSS